MSRCLSLGGAAAKPKDWLQLWPCLQVPVELQAVVLRALQTALRGGAVLAELVRAHCVKLWAAEEAVAVGGAQAVRELLYQTYPRGPEAPYGWARIGWGWQEWWKVCQRTLRALEQQDEAFVALALLLERLENGVPLAKQAVWTPERLAQVGAGADSRLSRP